MTVVCRALTTHQAVAVEGGVDAAKEEPAGPQILQSELQDEVGQQHQRPHHHELQDGVRAERRQKDERGSRGRLLPTPARLLASHKTHNNNNNSWVSQSAAASALKPCRFQNSIKHTHAHCGEENKPWQEATKNTSACLNTVICSSETGGYVLPSSGTMTLPLLDPAGQLAAKQRLSVTPLFCSSIGCHHISPFFVW